MSKITTETTVQSALYLARRAVGDVTLAAADAIDAASMAAGMALADWFGHEARRVYAILAEGPDDRQRRLIELIRKRGGRISVRELMQFDRQFRNDAAGAEAALNELVRANRGRWETDDHGGGRGRPGRVFVLAEASTVYGNGAKPAANGNTVDVDEPDATGGEECEWTG